MLYEDEKEAEMVPRAFEKETFLLFADSDTNGQSGVFYLFEERCFRCDQCASEADERGRGAPHHFKAGQGSV